MLDLLFSKVRPDMLTIETIRYLDLPAMEELLDLTLLDDDFLEAVRRPQGGKHPHGCELPHEYRQEVYEFIIGHLERLKPDMPYAFCRETFDMWNKFGVSFARHGQTTRRYLCNCGPHCAPATAVVG
jgi:hypothetical protein